MPLDDLEIIQVEFISSCDTPQTTKILQKWDIYFSLIHMLFYRILSFLKVLIQPVFLRWFSSCFFVAHISKTASHISFQLGINVCFGMCFRRSICSWLLIKQELPGIARMTYFILIMKNPLTTVTVTFTQLKMSHI